MGEACSKCGERRNAYRVLVWKPEGKGPFGRPVNICNKGKSVPLQVRGAQRVPGS